MAEGPAEPRVLHSWILQWLVDNFCICEGYSLPCCLMYEIYVETCRQNAQNQVNPATFGKLVHLAFPDLDTHRLETRGNASGHVAFEKSIDYNNIIQQERTCENNSPLKTSPVGPPLSEIRRCPLCEQELAKKYSYTMMAFLADEYCNYCQDILQTVKNHKLKRVQDLLMSFWKSLQQDVVMFMALPDVRQLLKSYDTQLYKGLEDILLCDFLDDVPIQDLKSVRLFSKKFKRWLLNALEGFPSFLQVSKLKGHHIFKRLWRKTYLSNMVKTTRTVLRNIRKVRLLKSDLQAIIGQCALNIPLKSLASDPSHAEEPESHPEMKYSSVSSIEWELDRPGSVPCEVPVLPLQQHQVFFFTACSLAVVRVIIFYCFADRFKLFNFFAGNINRSIDVFLNCLSSHLQVFVCQPSKSKEQFIKLAASFQLKWNFLLTAVSKAMTLCHRESFGFWHLFHLLLLDYVTHIFQSCLEEEEEEEDVGNPKDMLPDDRSLVQPIQALFHPLDSPLPQEYASPGAGPPRVTLGHKSQDLSPMGVSSMVLWVLGLLVDTATSNKLVQVLLEDKVTKSAMRLSVPMEEEAIVTLKDGQRLVIRISDVS